jgi:N-acetylmuramoyl-L-alanine amidase
VKIKDHKIEGAPYVSTTKVGGKLKPKFIVLHFTAGWTSAGDIDTLAKSSAKVSAHGVLSREGTWTQIVPFNTVAWHAGPSKSHGYTNLNQYSIGIEVSNIGYLKKLDHDLYMDEYGNRIHANGEFYNGKRTTYSPPNTWHMKNHPRLKSGFNYVWEPFYEKQLDVLEEVVSAILAEYPTIEWIVTHEEIDTREWKTDINGGGAFPMKRFEALLDRKPREKTMHEMAQVPDLNRKEAVGTVWTAPSAGNLKCDVYAECNDTAPVVASLKKNTELEVIHGDPEWSFVKLINGTKAWIKSTNLIFK